MTTAVLIAFAAAIGSAGDGDETVVFAAATPVLSQPFGADSDADYDGLPDGWSRRTGPGFPGYIDVRLDRTAGRSAVGSLKFTANGAAAAVYSAPVRIDDRHVHVFEAAVRTRGLRYEAAVCTVSVLDVRRGRIARHVSPPVSGTSGSGTRDAWTPIRIGPIEPTPGQRFVVVGCHLIRPAADALGVEKDMDGAAWFDDLRLAQAPTLSLAGRTAAFYRRPEQPGSIAAAVAGLEPDMAYGLTLVLRDADGQELARSERPLARPAGQDDPPPQPWTPAGVGRGFYRIEAALSAGGRTLVRRDSTFVVADPPGDGVGPFGWTIASPPRIDPESFAAIAAEAGATRVKMPLWRNAGDPQAARRDEAFVAQLGERKIAVVGLLDPPPDDLRRRFAAEWSAAAELHRLPPATLVAALEPLIARHGARVRDWQLGRDGDASFAAVADLAGTLATVRTEFDRVGRNTPIGLPWPAGRPGPALSNGFVSILDPDAAPLPTGTRVWASLRPRRDVPDRAADLLLRLVAARQAGAEAVFCDDVLSPAAGLLRPDGSPTELFLPFRVAAVALGEKRPIGSLPVDGGSRTALFAGDAAAVVLWRDDAGSESFVPGGTPAAVDHWGRPVKIESDPETGRITLPVGPAPVIVTGASPALLRWQLEAGLETPRLDSRHGPQAQAIVGRNPFAQGVSGKLTLKLPSDWGVDPNRWPLTLAAGESFRLPLTITLPADVSLGTHDATLEFEIQADRPYRFDVRREIAVGRGDVEIAVIDRRLPDGRLEVVQTITNRTDPPETLNLRCNLFAPGRQRQQVYVVKLGPGQDVKRYALADADALAGERLWLRAEQENGRRVLNYRWQVGQDW